MATHIRQARRRARGTFYGCWLVGLALLINALATAPIFGGVGIWLKALELHFGWSRTQLAGAFSLAQLQGSVVGPLVGFLVDRFGARRVVLSGLLMMGAGFIILSQTTNLAIFYLSYAVIMLGASAGSWLPLMTALNNWFIRKRSTAMAIAGEGFFLGSIALSPVLAWAVTPEHIGWQTTAWWVGVVFLVIAWPVTRLIRNRPAEHGEHPDGDPALAVSASTSVPNRASEFEVPEQPLPNFTARQAMRTRTFWLITFGHALSSMLIGTLTVHLVPLLTDQGLSLQMASYVWAVVMAVGFFFQLVGGYVGDRVPKNVAIAFFFTFRAGGVVMATVVHGVPMAFLFAVVLGIGFGGSFPLTISIRGDYFGQRAFATITGISMAPMYGFMLAAPLFAAAMFDARGSYFLPFIILGSLGGFSSLFFLLAKRPSPVDTSRTVEPLAQRP